VIAVAREEWQRKKVGRKECKKRNDRMKEEDRERERIKKMKKRERDRELNKNEKQERGG
jgi:hypothetical protein